MVSQPGLQATFHPQVVTNIAALVPDTKQNPKREGFYSLGTKKPVQSCLFSQGHACVNEGPAAQLKGIICLEDHPVSSVSAEQHGLQETWEFLTLVLLRNFLLA